MSLASATRRALDLAEKARPRLSIDEHHSRRSRRLQTGTCSIYRKKICNATEFQRKTSATARQLSAFANCCALNPNVAWQFYEAGSALLGLIDKDSRGALWLLVHTYSARYFGRIELLDFAVFGERIRLTKAEKMMFIAKARFGPPHGREYP